MLFPISANAIQLTTAAVDAGDAVNNGIRINAAGTLARATTTTTGATANNGLLMSPTTQLVYADATAGLPANTQFCNGLPLTNLGALCISTDAMATYSNGVPMAANGAVCAVITP